jgi:anti-sigma factor RsiW
MIDCAGLAARVDGYLAGTLPPGDAEALEAHAAGCDRCAVTLEACTRLPMALSREVPAPDAVRAATLRRVREAHRRRRIRRVVIPAALAASMVLAWGVTRPADKAAMMRARESQSPMAMAESRAVPEFEALARARATVERALAEAPPAERPRLEAERARLARQYDRFVTLVQEFET